MKKYKYSVALSFSGKQRSYVERVSNELSRLHVQHFYDFNEQENLWGKDLAKYLDKIYYEDAEFFVPFISKDYAETVWPNLELSAALDRNMNDLRPNFQRYILPVYFDNIRLPGIPKSIGYYDANKISPEELAKAIYNKLFSAGDNSHRYATIKKSVSELGDLLERFSLAQTNILKEVNSSHTERICAICNKTMPLRIVLVYGERGLGKRSSIYRSFLEIKEKVIYYIRPFYEIRYKYDSIIQSLGLDVRDLLSQTDLDFESSIKRSAISLFSEKPSVVYVEHYHMFDKESRSFLYELAYSLLVRHTQKDVCFIIELDTDTDTNLIDSFYELVPNQIELIEFSRLTKEEITSCFYNYCRDIEISKKNLKYIIHSSLGNIMYLNVIINYLEGSGYIKEIDGHYVCNHLPEGALADVIRKYLIQRYNKLNEPLKDVLSKSSILGCTFDIEHLQTPFRIINAVEKLSRIERISNLIEHYTNEIYAFETKDVYEFIQSNIPSELQLEWHSVLAHYFQQLYNRTKRRNKTLSIEKDISLVYRIAKHFKYAENYQDALSYFRQLVLLYLKICDYKNNLTVIEDIRFIISHLDIDDNKMDQIEYEITIASAECYKGLGQYNEAHDFYMEALSFISETDYSKELIDVFYNKCYCLYMMGRVIEAQDILTFICQHFNLKDKNKKDYIRIISLLASICDSTNNTTMQKKLYIEALTYYRENKCEKEYYELLKMASMVFDESIAIEMEREAVRYFRNNQSVRNLAETLHNLATTELYLLKMESVDKYLQESISLFDIFGSKAVHYPLNTKGIVEMVINQNYSEAISTLTSALSFSTEKYSEIAIRVNLIQCFLQLKNYEEAYKMILLVDELIKNVPHGVVPVYETFHLLNWLFFFFHKNEYEKCEVYLKKLNKQCDIEERHKYIARSMRYIIRKKGEKKTRNTAGTAPYPIYRSCVEKGLFFATLRFFE